MSKRVGQSVLATLAVFALLLLPGLASADPGNGNGSQTQGNSKSNPDGGGVDKPYPADGQPAESQGPDYFDGNNGCGQDKKSGEPRESGTERPGWDDNNGWCGKPHFAGQASGGNVSGSSGGNVSGPSGGNVSGPSGGNFSGPSGGNVSGSSGGNGETLVGSAGFSGTAPTLVLGATFTNAGTPNSTAVLGANFERGQALARTGMEAKMVFLLGLSMLALGMLMLSVDPRTSKN